MYHDVVQKLIKSPRGLAVVAMLIVLPLLVISVYVVQSTRSRATGACLPEDIQTSRISQSVGQISFRTPCAVAAKIYCASNRDGVQFLCAEDATESTTHMLQTAGVTLNTGLSYYMFIDTGVEKRSIGYLQADPSDPTVGRNVNEYSDELLGTTAEEERYDIALDINQDGIINGYDLATFYTEE